MRTAKLFANGRSQAVRLPADLRFKGTEVYVKQIGNAVVLLPRAGAWGPLALALETFEPGFALRRDQPKLQRRTRLRP